MQKANLLNLPENYTFKYCQSPRYYLRLSPSSELRPFRYSLPTRTSWKCFFPTTTHSIDLYHALTWPELSYVATNPKGEVVGYILAKM